MLQTMLNLTMMDLPTPVPEAPPGMDKFTTILNWTLWGVFLVCLGSLIISGGRIAMAHRNGEETQGFKGVVLALVGAIIAGSAATIMTFFMA